MSTSKLVFMLVSVWISAAAFGDDHCSPQFISFTPTKNGDRIDYCARVPDVIAEFNRHSALQIVVIGDEWPEVGGTSFAAEPEHLVRFLIARLGVEVIIWNEHMVKLAPPKGGFRK